MDYDVRAGVDFDLEVSLRNWGSEKFDGATLEIVLHVGLVSYLVVLQRWVFEVSICLAYFELRDPNSSLTRGKVLLLGPAFEPILYIFMHGVQSNLSWFLRNEHN